MIDHDAWVVMKTRLSELYPTLDARQKVLELAGIDLRHLDLSGVADAAWSRALTACAEQGPDGLESLLIEVLEAHPPLTEARVLLRQLAQGALVPEAPESSLGSLGESIARDPLEGVALVLAYAEASQASPAILVQLHRCHQMLLEISEERRLHGRMLAREEQWRNVVREAMQLAHELEQKGDE